MKNSLSILAALALLPFVATFAPAQDAQPEPAKTAETPAKTADAEKPAPAAENVPESAPAESPEAVAKREEMKKIKLMNMEKSKLDAQMGLEQSKLRKKLASEEDERIRLEAAIELRKAKTAAEFAASDEEKRMLDANFACANARDNIAMLDRSAKLREAEIESKIARASQEFKLNTYNLKLTRARLQQGDRKIATEVPKYLKNPLVDGTLYISDRRIEFNGPVTDELAEYVVDRLHFFNNKNSEYPIFIVITNSPGGSVFAGYQILKAMESSKAPVCVVLKNFCASMAAIITTLAPESYCYSNSIILHHQASSSTSGNMSVMSEQLASTKYWVGRIFAPVCAKLGVSQEEFVKDMYANFSTGDWSVFGKEAVERKWINNVVDKMVETGIVLNDADVPGASGFIYNHTDLTQKSDDRGNVYYELPTLKTGDAWLMFDPENRYRAR